MNRRGFLGIALPAVLPAAVLAVPFPEVKSNYGLTSRVRHIRYPDSVYKITGVISEQTESGTQISFRIKDENYDFVVREENMDKFFEKVS